MFSAMRLVTVNQAISTWVNAIHSKFHGKLDSKFNGKLGCKFFKMVFHIISYSVYPSLFRGQMKMIEMSR